jgi:acyl carrier protein
MTDVVPTLRHFLTSTLRVSAAAEMADDYPLVARGVVDSIELMQVVEFLEATWGVSLDDTEIVPENLGSLKAMAALVERKAVAGGRA